MKRTPLTRKPALRSKRTALTRTPLAKVNPARKKKRRLSYARGMAAYRKSQTYRDVEARAGGRCENRVVTRSLVSGTPGAAASWWTGPVWPGPTYEERAQRCQYSGPLAHHHKTYARFGGRELAEDMLAVCPACHALLESQHPTRSHGR
jgi:hypothetical protein